MAFVAHGSDVAHRPLGWKKSKYIMMLLCMSGVNVTRYMSIMTKVNTRVKGDAASNFKASMEDFDSY